MAFHEHFEVDDKTGFLTPKPSSKLKNGFTAPQKVEWLETYRTTFNFTKACNLCGTNTRTVHDHINGDDKFGIAYKEAKDAIADHCQEALLLFVHKNPTAAFGILKALRPMVWRENYQEKGPRKEERLKNLLDAAKEADKKEGKE